MHLLGSECSQGGFEKLEGKPVFMVSEELKGKPIMVYGYKRKADLSYTCSRTVLIDGSVASVHGFTSKSLLLKNDFWDIYGKLVEVCKKNGCKRMIMELPPNHYEFYKKYISVWVGGEIESHGRNFIRVFCDI